MSDIHPFHLDNFLAFYGRDVRLQKKLYLFQTVMGGGELINRTYTDNVDMLAKLHENKKRFDNLDYNTRTEILHAYNALSLEESNRTFFSRCRDGVELLLFQTSHWFRGWLLLSLITTILLLKKSPGAPYALIILPCIALLWWAEAAQTPHTPSLDEQFYPTEKYLLTRYGIPVSDLSITQQRDILSRAWEKYLAQEWSRNHKVEEGEWQFQLARLRKTIAHQKGSIEGPSGALLCLFFIWNCTYAFVAYRFRVPLIEGVSLG